MCGRFVADLTSGQLTDVFGVSFPPDYPARYNICPTQNVLVIRQFKNIARHLDLVRWGFVPGWAKEMTKGFINAHSETIDSRPSFRQAFKHHRCIVPASGFYEWKKTDTGKTPYYIQMSDTGPMPLAGIWETWLSPTGQAIETCSILTTMANTAIAPIHDRMPVILSVGDFNLWLDTDIQETDQLRHLFTPYPPEKMITYPVSPLVNNPAYDNPDCIKELR